MTFTKNMLYAILREHALTVIAEVEASGRPASIAMQDYLATIFKAMRFCEC